MEKLSARTNKIIIISIIVVLLVIVTYLIIGLVKNINKNKETQIVSMQQNEEEYTEEEVEIVYLNNLAITEENEPNDENKQDTESSNNKNNNSSVNSTSKYYIKVNCGANVVTIYTKDAEGNYTVPYKAMVCSTGTATPRYLDGKYAIKGRWRWGALFGGVYGQYCVHIVDQILFHSVPYTARSADALEYWEYDKLRNFSFSWMYKANC